MSFIAQHLSTDLFPERQRVAFRQDEFGRAVLSPDVGPLGDRPFRTDGKPDVPVTHLYDPAALALGASRDEMARERGMRAARLARAFRKHDGAEPSATRS